VKNKSGDMTKDALHYSGMIDNAMRGVVRDILKQISKTGLPGDHHFYISFLTQYGGVHISEQLKERYPTEITIVLQHQFWDFKVEENRFTVTLSFGGVPEKLVVPYAALTAFADPSVKFGLQFQQDEAEDESPANIDLLQDLTPEEIEGLEAMDEQDDDASAEIISLDSFRNNK
jgi:uncharacterized protein